MTKLNNKLLSVFLILGSIFFIVLIFMFISKELMVKPAKHSVKFNGVTVIKNDYEDLTAAQRKAYEDEHANPYTQNHEVQTCTIDLANASDNLSYAKTNSFSIKTINRKLR